MKKLEIKLVKPAMLAKTANIISAGGKNPLTAMFGRDETQNSAVNGYSIYCVFELLTKQEITVIKAVFPADGPLNYPSLTPLIPAAVWYEREIQDMFGLIPDGHPDPRPLVLHEKIGRAHV